MDCAATTNSGTQCTKQGHAKNNNMCLQHFKITSTTQRPVTGITEATRNLPSNK